MRQRPWQLWVATLLGAGLSPRGPGTVGSLATTAILLGVFLSVEGWSYWAWQGLLVAGIVVASAATVWLGPWILSYWKRKDPGAFVLDEVAGVCLTALFLPMFDGWGQAYALLVAFLAFRIFDIAKPWPCKKLEGLPGGWGVLADDLMAALYANVFCQSALRYFGG